MKWLFSAFCLLGATVLADRPFSVFDNGLTDVESVEEQAKLLKRLGYDGICTRPSHCTPALLAALDRHDLKVVASYVTLAPNSEPLPGYLDQHFQQLEGRGTLIWLGVRDEKAAEGPAVETIRQTCDLAKKYGLEVVLYPHVHFRTDTIARTERLRKRAKRDNLGMSFNLCHFLAQTDASTLEDAIRSVGPHLKLVQISGANPLSEPRADWGQLILPLGEGGFDMNRVFKTLDEMGYEGPVNLQCYQVPGPAAEHLGKSIRAWRKYNE